MTDHNALIVRFEAGITVGITRSHPVNVCPSFVGFAGLIIAVLKSCMIGETKEPPSESKVMVYVLIVKIPKRVTSLDGIFPKVYLTFSFNTSYHPSNVYPNCTGSVGRVSVELYSCILNSEDFTTLASIRTGKFLCVFVPSPS